MYKKMIYKIFAIFLMLILVVISGFSVSAAESTNYTYTISADGDWARTQDAYLTSKTLLRSSKLSDPSDIFVKDDKLFVADTGNSRVVVLNLKTNSQTVLGEEFLESPTGIFVDGNDLIYVADTKNCSIFVLAPNGNLVKEYERPTNKTFGENTQYIPSKVAVNSAGILYIVSEGSYDGMVQIDKEGNFLGYFGYNNNPMTITDYLQDIFFTEEQKSKIFNRVPFSFGNLDIDSKGSIYSVTMAVEGSAVKRHDMSGQNKLPTNMYDEKNFIDVTVGNYGQIYAVTQTGLLFEYDTDGNLLFSLGGLAIAEERNGLFTTADAIDTDKYGNVYILDGERGVVHTLIPTEMTDSVHTAMDLFNNGHYSESSKLWKEIAVICGDNRIVENGIANCMFQLQDYETAAEHYRTAENREGYSDAYWQIRSKQVTNLLPFAVISISIIFLVVFIIRRRFGSIKRAKKQAGWIKIDLKLIGDVIKHPIDSFYAIRREGRGHFGTATLIYAVAFLVFVCNFLLKGFVISTANPDNTSPIYVSILFLIPVSLFIFSNFFVGEINESEARFRDVYVATSYVMSPFIVFMPFIIVISHFVTFAESSLLSLATIAIYVWVAVLLFISTKEIHAYNMGNVIKNILITIFLMAVIILVVSLIVMFWDQLIDFVFSIIREVKYRVS